MPGTERALNVILGANVLAWAALGIIDSSPAKRWGITLLNVLVGVLFITRRPLRRSGSAVLCAICLPSFIVWGLAFYLSPRPDQWPDYAVGLFALGAIVTAASFLCLGRSFAVLPADRGTVMHGPYRVVRHPAYAGELLMVVACFAAGPTWPALIPLAAAAPLVALRILAEKRLLSRSINYREYSQHVAWRLLPGVW